jgi:hypothetical protein
MVGNETGTDFRSAAADLAGTVEHVLVRQRHAVQRTEFALRLDRPIRLARLLTRRVGGHADEAVEVRLQALDAVETGFDERLGAQSALRNGSGGFAQRERRGIVHRGAPCAAPLSSRR